MDFRKFHRSSLVKLHPTGTQVSRITTSKNWEGESLMPFWQDTMWRPQKTGITHNLWTHWLGMVNQIFTWEMAVINKFHPSLNKPPWFFTVPTSLISLAITTYQPQISLKNRNAWIWWMVFANCLVEPWISCLKTNLPTESHASTTSLIPRCSGYQTTSGGKGAQQNRL